VLVKTEITTAFTDATQSVPGLKMVLSVDGWESAQGIDIIAVCADIVDPFSFQHVHAVIACREIVGEKSSKGIANFLDKVVVSMKVPGWDTLESAVSTLTTDSAPNMLGVASEVDEQDAAVTHVLAVPPIGAAIVVLHEDGDDGFWHAIVAGVEVTKDNTLLSISVHWLNEARQLEGLDDITHPWWGTTSDLEPDKVRERRANR
jgi:hypothetical protein